MGGERGYATKYMYFSERAATRTAEALDVDLGGGDSSWTVKLSLSFGVGLERAQKRAEPGRDQVAAMIERAVGDLAVNSFWTPPKAQYAKGSGHVQFLRFIGPDGDRPVFHTRVVRDDDYRTDIVLFGSMDNCAGYVSKAPLFDAGWTSSAMWSIEEFLTDRINTYDDPGTGDESLAVEALKIALMQGKRNGDPDPGKPYVRGYTIGHGVDLEWFADIYLDTELTPERWLPDHYEPMNTDRILVGAPLWVRTSRPRELVMYDPMRRAEGITGRHRRRKLRAAPLL